MAIRGTLAAALAASALALAAPSFASQIFSTSYDMPNGGGQASGGSFNYWDLAYSDSGCKTCDGAPLSGGHGDLTDGVVATQEWDFVENNAGTGPYVGWYPAGPLELQLNPTITFHFAGSPTITGVNIHMDNSHVGGVAAPANILVDGVNQPYTPPPVFSIGWVALTGLNLTGGTHTVQFVEPQWWTFISEVTFDGVAGRGVPEPASWVTMIAGFGMVGGALRSRRGQMATA
jgi:hypothetical protein